MHPCTRAALTGPCHAPPCWTQEAPPAEWVRSVTERGGGVDEPDDAPPEESEMWRREFLRKREQAYAEAMKPRYGDTRTFAYHASKKGWRARWSLAQRLRAEELITYVHPLKQPKQRPLDKFLGGAGNRAPARPGYRSPT